MNSIQNHSSSGEMYNGQNALSDSRFSSYVRKESFNAYESLDTGLTIKTKEGDLVTLTSSSYAQMDSFMYDSKGVLKTESGTAAVTQNIREITLETGESFSFSVEGDLSEEELEDIAAIVKGIDEIVSEVAQGDMEDAVTKALSMGGYDTVSMYSADIAYQKSYSAKSEVQAQTAEVAPKKHHHHRRKNHSIQKMDQFFDKMAEKLEKYDGRLVEKAQKPLDKLFKHYLENEKDEDSKKSLQYNAIKNIRKKVSELIDKMTNDMFKGKLSAFME